MDLVTLKRTIEALLFAAGAPITVPQIVEVVEELDTRTARSLLTELQDEYDANARGFKLVEVQKGYQLATRQDYSASVQKLFTKEIAARLSPAALEALAIVAYHQPVTRAEVEDIRGVNSDSVLNSLIERKLITISGRRDVPGRPLLYATTDRFLEHFGLRDVADLPSLDELGEMFARPAPLAADDVHAA
ncbi:SMC-Scp complex subunit ScpB [Candidatus Poribacteria bacterium]|jgi:segregation and condensation protein B|nr:SMC-Scp complex subunit ScpB [Candidatus Poribacteria bacterium]MBT5531500.1 SMC-Scp complex subunit ScpB [Candidatus Poribacteria bacterium]MBT5712302.1 SMC-Scp complex subunit ScpB [Candidatus Poribacteria bacterium]MBT7095792.1 SMC-Scp complex subunit ScpB [Candidatus Poribacteria bacterium]MBT7805638.1 SMC-Scp complex subunit ScpB [Candidatus Poribacteria bacterium]